MKKSDVNYRQIDYDKLAEDYIQCFKIVMDNLMKNPNDYIVNLDYNNSKIPVKVLNSKKDLEFLILEDEILDNEINDKNSTDRILNNIIFKRKYKDKITVNDYNFHHKSYYPTSCYGVQFSSDEKISVSGYLFECYGVKDRFHYEENIKEGFIRFFKKLNINDIKRMYVGTKRLLADPNNKWKTVSFWNNSRVEVKIKICLYPLNNIQDRIRHTITPIYIMVKDRMEYLKKEDVRIKLIKEEQKQKSEI